MYFSFDDCELDSCQGNSEIIANDWIVDIGLELEKILINANRATQGLIATIFSSLVLCLVLVSYRVVVSMGLNDASTGKLKIWAISAGSFSATMYLIRFYRLMNAGQQLSIKIKQSRRAFENNIILKESTGVKDEFRQKTYMLQKRLEVYQYVAPISPYAVLGLNNKTFCATLATIISYIVIMIKLRGVESAKTTAALKMINETVLT